MRLQQSNAGPNVSASVDKTTMQPIRAEICGCITSSSPIINLTSVDNSTAPGFCSEHATPMGSTRGITGSNNTIPRSWIVVLLFLSALCDCVITLSIYPFQSMRRTLASPNSMHRRWHPAPGRDANHRSHACTASHGAVIDYRFAGAGSFGGESGKSHPETRQARRAQIKSLIAE